MTELASSGQLRAAFLRWALVLVPGILFLGFFSGQVAGSGAGNPWFMELTKPSLYPPPQLFGIVWSILYAVIALALAMVVTAYGAPGRRNAIIAFAVQLALNLAWCLFATVLNWQFVAANPNAGEQLAELALIG